jgi:hypothetical protein
MVAASGYNYQAASGYWGMALQNPWERLGYDKFSILQL